MEDMLSQILNDPEKLQSAISMASSMLGGNAPAAEKSASKAAPTAPAAGLSGLSFGQPGGGGGGVYDPSAELMQKAMPVLTEIAKSGHDAVSREKLNLLNAVKPFVADSVGSQIDHGLRLVSIARMARAAMKQLGTNQGQDGEGSHV